MAGNIDYLQRQAKRRNLYGIAFGKRHRHLCNTVRTWTEDRHGGIFQQGRDTADMVSMMMCQ